MSKTINDVIEEYCKKLPPSEIFQLMKEVVSRRGVYKAVKRFKDTGLVLQESGVTLKEL